MKILIFGAGKFYQNKKKEIPSDVDVVAFLDNDPALQGKCIDGRPVISPCEISRLIYDKVLIMSVYEKAMKNQLIDLGVKSEDILYWDQLPGAVNKGVFKLYCGNDTLWEYKKKVLIISTDLDYNGGTIAAFYAAKVLQKRGNYTIVAAPAGNRIFIDEATQSGINIVICPALTCMQKEVLFWVRQFDIILVNVFQMALCALKISRIKPVMWWIHEPGEFYEKTIDRFQEYMCREQLGLIEIYAVSDIAQKNFIFHFGNQMKGVLPYGIPDQVRKNSIQNETDGLVFAIIGSVCPIKAQNMFIKAIRLLTENEKRSIQFWVIGHIGNDKYSTEIKDEALTDKSIQIMGKLNRSEMYETYGKIDVVVCPSLEDSLPIVVTEGMMYGKTCIVSDKTGSARYIRNRENGLICKAGDPGDLCRQMRWVIHNREKLVAIGKKARRIYEQNFDIEIFGRRLENALQDTTNNWRLKWRNQSELSS